MIKVKIGLGGLGLVLLFLMVKLMTYSGSQRNLEIQPMDAVYPQTSSFSQDDQSQNSQSYSTEEETVEQDSVTPQ